MQIDDRFVAEINRASRKFSEELIQLRMRTLSLCGGGHGGDGEDVAGLGSLQDLCNIEDELQEVNKRVKEGTNGFKVGEGQGVRCKWNKTAC